MNIESQLRFLAQAEIERMIGAAEKAPSSGRIEIMPQSGRMRLDAGTGTPRTDLSGRRLVRPGHPEIYLVDPDGYRRRVPNHTTYNRIFRNWDGVTDYLSIGEIPLRPQLATGSVLVRGDSSARIYLLDEGVTRLIPNATVMDKYWFGWARIYVLKQVLFDRLPVGPDWQ